MPVTRPVDDTRAHAFIHCPPGDETGVGHRHLRHGLERPDQARHFGPAELDLVDSPKVPRIRLQRAGDVRGFKLVALEGVARAFGNRRLIGSEIDIMSESGETRHPRERHIGVHVWLAVRRLRLPRFLRGIEEAPHVARADRSIRVSLVYSPVVRGSRLQTGAVPISGAHRLRSHKVLRTQIRVGSQIYIVEDRRFARFPG